ncbi:glycoside hydrolase family 16 protein [Pseudocercospora fijiensis CIRAD86]|uniref:Glycoside hydrolase family 16 protein n=1 Tax=Pseudocercospora fijiensis (strain CIRAD86) TaxID=383855 RepID=N1QC02_PSEFD|nr:glycoside hydrolase family 16 protein [Pseudocercospora fijiensis CIRAD86]EME88837.1 glycoside hydrolase family 16 protein [Pseudocercospora fijiensis CIRAD86]
MATLNADDCDCGFVDSKDPTRSIFANLFAVNFTSAKVQQLEDLFMPANYDVIQVVAPYTRDYSVDQLQYSSTGLDLTVSPSTDGKNIPCAQIITKEKAFFYGSYRARIRVATEPGTVAAFYIYKNDSSEIDIEYLSAWTEPTLLYTVKPQVYLPSGNPDDSTYQRERWSGLDDEFREEPHEWSWTWLPDIVYFGIDANYLKNITANVPQAPGRIALSHWSNGDPHYSLGPPKQNTTITVSFLQAIYNDTSMPILPCERSSSACLIADGAIMSSLAPNITSQGGPSVTSQGGSASSPPPVVTHMNAGSRTSNGALGWLLMCYIFVPWLGWWRSTFA